MVMAPKLVYTSRRRFIQLMRVSASANAVGVITAEALAPMSWMNRRRLV